MKKLIFTIMCAACTSVLFAQGVGLGIKAGPNFANVVAKDVNTSSITGYHVGAYLNLNFTESFGVTPEVLWSARGSKLDKDKFETNYITVPVMFHVKPASFLSLEAGPQFSFLTDAKLRSDDYKSQLKTNDFGVAFGAKLHLPLSLNVGARYVLGFTNMSDVKQEDIKNRTFQIYAGWTLFGDN